MLSLYASQTPLNQYEGGEGNSDNMNFYRSYPHENPASSSQGLVMVDILHGEMPADNRFENLLFYRGADTLQACAQPSMRQIPSEFLSLSPGKLPHLNRQISTTPFGLNFFDFSGILNERMTTMKQADRPQSARFYQDLENRQDLGGLMVQNCLMP